MSNTILRHALLASVLAVCAARAQATRKPLSYIIRLPDPASKTFVVDMDVPSDGRDSVILMMPIWSPGMYRLQSYGDRVTAISAKAPDGAALDVSKRRQAAGCEVHTHAHGHSVVHAGGAARQQSLERRNRNVRVIIGPATYITLVEPRPSGRGPARIAGGLETGGDVARSRRPDGKPNHFVAPDYDVLADSPILAGVDLVDDRVHGRRRAALLDVSRQGRMGRREGRRRADAADRRAHPLLGTLPLKKYAFLNIVTGGGGGSGVEHLNSVAITSGGREPMTPEARFRNAAFISHEYFHAMNVKRLRPVELGPFDYENAPVTTGLWVGEGLTSYFGDLLAARAGIGSTEDYLALESRHITDLQTKQPGRLVQTLEQSSSQMFERLPADKKVDYYVKGPVVGLVLDAHIRRLTNGKKSMDDVIRLEYKRWSGARGYTARSSTGRCLMPRASTSSRCCTN